MKLNTFIENRYQELTVDEGHAPYCVKNEAEVRALQFLLVWFRGVLKFLYLPKVIFDFVLVCIGYQDEPKPVRVNKAKADKEAEDAKKAALKEASNVTSLKQ